MLEPRKFYRVENMVRAQTSRVQRQSSPTRHRAALWVLGKRVLPRNPLLLTPAEFEKNKLVLLSKVRLGEISIVRPDQVRIDSKNDGTLIYYPLNKPATFVEPPMGNVVDDVPAEPPVLEPVKDTFSNTEIAFESIETAPTPEPVSGIVEEHVSTETTAEVTTSAPESPHLCLLCREQPAKEGSSLCVECGQPALQVERKPIEIDTMPQEETPPEVVEDLAEETPKTAKQSRKNKNKGKKS
jgi:hypothetical protein